MLFTSLAFILFFPLVLWVYWFVLPPILSYRNLWLLIASYFFYGYAFWPWLGILWLSTALNFFWARHFLVPKGPTWRVAVGIGFNLLLLIVCKYGLLFREIFNFHSEWSTWVIPLGVSFFTMHGVSYLIDVYRGQISAETSMVRFGLFMAFFPLLVAGPIERAFHLLPQIQRPRILQFSDWKMGFQLMLWGFLKKMGIADGLAETADLMFAQYDQFHGFSLLFGAAAFSFQIYADFSGYSDIARGLALFFGFNLLVNFRFPYQATNISEFWKRWHISLSSWFRDYVYIPLGGSRGSMGQTQRNIAVVFLLSGLWHGPSLTFAAWGGIHGLGYAWYQFFNRTIAFTLPRWISIFLTWLFVTVGWIFFRAESIGHAMAYLERMVYTLWENPFATDGSGKGMLFFLIPLFLMEWYQKQRADIVEFPANPWIRYPLIGMMLLWIWGTIVSDSESPTFIYFNF